VTVDVAVVGAPFLDITFEGLPGVPSVGEELVGRGLHLTPGGTGIQAIGLARLGVSVALVAPIGDDPAGRILAEMLEEEGVGLAGGRAASTPVTALLSTPDGTAMASFVSDADPTAEDVSAVGASAVVLSIGRLHLAPAEARVYAVTGPGEVELVGGAPGAFDRRPRAFVCNAAEATILTGAGDPRGAAMALASYVGTAVVTLGADGALGAEGEGVVEARAPEVDAVDATGAGDLFVAGYVWSDLQGDDLQRRLALATLYAALSVGAPTAVAGALDRAAFLEEAHRRLG
jgi:ribokinase